MSNAANYPIANIERMDERYVLTCLRTRPLSYFCVTLYSRILPSTVSNNFADAFHKRIVSQIVADPENNSTTNRENR